MAVKDKLISNEVLKAVNDNMQGQVTDLKSALKHDDQLVGLVFYNKRWNGTDFVNSASRLANIVIEHCTKSFVIYASTGYQFAIEYWDSQGTHITSSGWVSSITIKSGEYWTIVIKNNSNTQISISEANVAVHSSANYDYIKSSVEPRILQNENDLTLLNCKNLIDGLLGTSGSHKDITYTSNNNGSYTVSGTASARSNFDLYSSNSALPTWAVPGTKYYVNFKSTNVEFVVYEYHSTTTVQLCRLKTNGSFTLPSDAVGMIIRLSVAPGDTVNDEIVFPSISIAPSNGQLLDKIDDEINDLSRDTEQNANAIKQNVTVSHGANRYASEETRVIYYNDSASSRSCTEIFHPKYRIFEVVPNTNYSVTVWRTRDDAHADAIASIENNSRTRIAVEYDDHIFFQVNGNDSGQNAVTLYYMTADIEQILASRIDLTDIKTYFASEYSDTLKKYYENNTEPGLALLFCTDIHYMSQQGRILKLDSVTDMAKVMCLMSSKVHFDGLVCLGDIVDAKPPTTTAETIEQMNYAMQMLHNVGLPILFTPGNHDDNRYIDDGSESYTTGEVYGLTMSYNRNGMVFDSTGLNGYYDFDSHNIRIIFVNANYYDQSASVWKYGWADDTVAWLSSVLTATPNTNSVILCSHLSPIQANNVSPQEPKNQGAVKNAIQTFIDGGGKYICTLYGHNHCDYSSNSPWLEITFDCAKSYNHTEPSLMPGAIINTRVERAASEDCWDVLLIQPHSKKIIDIRFGAGNDRQWTYS